MEVHPRLSVSEASTIGWPIERDLALWSSLGIRDVALLQRKLDASGDPVRAIERVRGTTGLRVDNLAVGDSFELANSAQWERGRERLRSYLDTAAALGSRCIVVTTGGPAGLSWEEAADALDEAIAPVVADARARGFELAVENTNSLRLDISFANTLRDTCDLARRLGIGVCMEINNAWCERGLADTVRRNVDLLRIVQVNDFVVGTLQTPDRAVPGDGDIPLRRVLGTVLEAGYRGPFELEIVGPRIEAEGYESAVRRSLDVLGRLLVDLGA
ncbi:MAG: sugar phosphate isomerase/epimerase family protein [Alphaproteobacteria bacterium]